MRCAQLLILLLASSAGCFRLGLDPFGRSDDPDADAGAPHDGDVDDAGDADLDGNPDDAGLDADPDDADLDADPDVAGLDADPDDADLDESGDVATDVDVACVPYSGFCDTAEDCCSGLPCTWRPMLIQGICCVDIGSPCSPGECCHGTCNASNICE